MISRGTRHVCSRVYVGTYVSGIVCFFVKPGVYRRRRLALRVFRDRRTLIMCRAFNTNLVFMRRKKVEVGRGKQDKRHVPDDGIILLHPPSCFVAFVSFVLSFALIAYLYPRRERLVNRKVRTRRCTPRSVNERTRHSHNAQRARGD